MGANELEIIESVTEKHADIMDTQLLAPDKRRINEQVGFSLAFPVTCRMK